MNLDTATRNKIEEYLANRYGDEYSSYALHQNGNLIVVRMKDGNVLKHDFSDIYGKEKEEKEPIPNLADYFTQAK